MKKILTFSILAAAMLAVSGYAMEPGLALSQLESYQGAPDIMPQFPMPNIGQTMDPGEFMETPQNNSTEDCSMQYGVEVCIAPNWPSCWENGDVEPCIDHVLPQQQYCYDGEMPLWLSVGNSGRWRQGCYSGNLAFNEKAGGAKIGVRFEKRGLALQLGGKKVYFNGDRGGKKAAAASDASKKLFQDFLADDPCGGLMACYNPIDPALLDAILAAYAADPAAQNYQNSME